MVQNGSHVVLTMSGRVWQNYAVTRSSQFPISHTFLYFCVKKISSVWIGHYRRHSDDSGCIHDVHVQVCVLDLYRNWCKHAFLLSSVLFMEASVVSSEVSIGC